MEPAFQSIEPCGLTLALERRDVQSARAAQGSDKHMYRLGLIRDDNTASTEVHLLLRARRSPKTPVALASALIRRRNPFTAR